MTNKKELMTEKELKFLLKVIKSTQKLGVKCLKFGSIEFELYDSESPVTRVRPTFKATKKAIAESEEQSDAQMRFDEARDEIAVMHVEDPVGFEQALIEKELDVDASGDMIEETYSQ